MIVVIHSTIADLEVLRSAIVISDKNWV